jgi:hypothetical protein
MELRPTQRRARLRLGRRPGASSRVRDGLSVLLHPAFVLASSPLSPGITVSHPELPPSPSIREHRRRSSRSSVSSPRGCARLSLVSVLHITLSPADLITGPLTPYLGRIRWSPPSKFCSCRSVSAPRMFPSVSTSPEHLRLSAGPP